MGFDVTEQYIRILIPDQKISQNSFLISTQNMKGMYLTIPCCTERKVHKAYICKLQKQNKM